MSARIRVVPAPAKRGEVVEVSILIQHDMETGYRRDDEGRVIPRDCINLLTCRYNGVEVFRADLSSGISANPYLQFYTVAVASGELEFSWIDDLSVQGAARAGIAVSE